MHFKIIKANIYIIVNILLWSCVSAPTGYVIGDKPLLDKREVLIAVHSNKPLPENLPDTVSGAQTDIALVEAMSTVNNISLIDPKMDSMSNLIYEDIYDKNSDIYNYTKEKGFRFVSAIRIKSYSTPRSSVTVVASSASSKTLQVELELLVYDVVIGKEYMAVTTAKTTQRSRSAVLSTNLDNATGEKSALSVAIEEGIFELTSLLF